MSEEFIDEDSAIRVRALNLERAGGAADQVTGFPGFAISFAIAGMGQHERVPGRYAGRPSRRSARVVFFFDLACPFTYPSGVFSRLPKNSTPPSPASIRTTT